MFVVLLASLCNLVSLHAMQQETFSFTDARTLRFVDAIERGDVDTVQQMLSDGADPKMHVTATQSYGRLNLATRSYTIMPLQIAASYSKSPQVISALLKAGADVHSQDTSVKGCVGHGPALLRICQDTRDPLTSQVPLIIDMLLKAGAKPNVFDCNASALGYRALAGDVESVKLLLAARARTEQIVYYRRSDTRKEELLLLPLALALEIKALQHKPECKAKVAAYETILDMLHKAPKRTIRRITVEQLRLLKPSPDVPKVEEPEV